MCCRSAFSSALMGAAAGSEWTCAQTVVAFHTGFTCSAASGSGTMVCGTEPAHNEQLLQVATLAAPTEGSLWTLTAQVSDAGAANSIMSLMAVLASKLQVLMSCICSSGLSAGARRSPRRAYLQQRPNRQTGDPMVRVSRLGFSLSGV